MTVPNPREKKGIYRDILLISESIPAWTRGFGIITFRLDPPGPATLRGK
jgi:hypothetical protein